MMPGDLPRLPRFEESLSQENDEECQQKAAVFILQLKPDWRREFLRFELFTNGITNKILCCSETVRNEKVVIRIFGVKTELVIDRNRELVNWSLLNLHQCAAPLLASFRNGLICGFQPGRTLTIHSVRDPVIFKEIARSMAKMHQIPPNKQAETNLNIFVQMRQLIENMPSKFEDAKQQFRFDTSCYMDKGNLQEQVAQLEHIIIPLESPVVFCHNDLLIFNILYDDRTRVTNPDYSLYPSREYQLIWLENYLNFYLNRPPSGDEIETLFKQVNIFVMTSHFFWSIWGIIQANFSTIDFDYLGYAITRFEEYFRIKSRFVKKISCESNPLV